MLARLRTFPLPTRADWAAFVDRSGDAAATILLIFAGAAAVALATTF